MIFTEPLVNLPPTPAKTLPSFDNPEQSRQGSGEFKSVVLGTENGSNILDKYPLPDGNGVEIVPAGEIPLKATEPNVPVQVVPQKQLQQ